MRVPAWVLALGDAVFVVGGFLLAYQVRFAGQPPAENYEPYRVLAPWLAVLALGVFSGLGLYGRAPLSFLETLRRLAVGTAVLSLLTAAATFWLRGFALPRLVLVLAGGLQVALLALWRLFFWRLEKAWHGERRVLLVSAAGAPGEMAPAEAPPADLPGREGDASAAQTPRPQAGTPREEELRLVARFLNLPGGWYRLTAIVPWTDAEGVEAALAACDVVVLAPSVPAEAKVRLSGLALAAAREVLVVPEMYEILILHGTLGEIDDIPVVEIPPLGLTWGQRLTKRAFDLAVTAVCLPLALPVMAAVAAAVLVSSGPPVIYRQERVGEGGRTFTLYKFRTMVRDAEAETGPVLASRDDPRVTPVGRWLRTLRLDELPQLFNVLRGDMSIVGPRPERPGFVTELADHLPGYRYRHLVRPGLTGLAQVAGGYATEPADKLRYDLYYVRNYSLLLDAKLLLRTLLVLLRREAAAGVGSPSGVEEQAASLLRSARCGGGERAGSVSR